MALIPHCDRCKQPGQVVQILGVDVCAACVAELRVWLEPLGPVALPSGRRRVSNRMEQAMHFIRRGGRVTAQQIADRNNEPVRRAYWALWGLAKHERLKHLGRGVFVLNQLENQAAE